jgi:tetratricopeptide (TPR) repeat protein
MGVDEPTLHVSNIRARLGRCALLCLLTVMIGNGCSEKKKALAEIREAFSQMNYEETMVLCQHALRKDIRDGEVYYYFGLSLLETGRDYEAFRRFEDAVAADSTMRSDIAERLLIKGRQAFGKGDKKRAADRLRFAADFDRGVELGSFKYLVADAYFGERGFNRAAVMYSSAIDERPDTAAAEVAYFNLSECYVALGDSAEALQALEVLLERFPKGDLAGRARWKLVNLLYEHAKSEFARGEYEVVVEEINALLARATNVSLVQRARFLLGEAYEHLEDYSRAYEQYKTIIEQDRGASGRIVERAREKINALRDAGLL